MCGTDPERRWAGKHVVFVAPNQVEVQECAESDPGAGEILVEARTTLISAGTEKSCLTGRANWASFPHYPGYSHAGVVRAVGDGVDAPAVGTRLYSQLPHVRFGRLAVSAAQNEETQTAHFNTLDTAAAIPDGVSDEEATFTTLGAVGLYGIRRAGIVPGESVVVLGLGVVGQLLVQLARLTGAYPVIGVDIISSRRALADQLGADETIDPRATAWADSVQEEAGGADVVFETAGVATLVRECVQATKVRGRVVIVSTIYEPVQLDFFPGLDEKDVSLIGCHQPNNPTVANVTYPWSQKRDRELILNYLVTGRLQVEPLISHRFRSDDAAEAHRVLLDPEVDKMGILLEWGDQA